MYHSRHSKPARAGHTITHRDAEPTSSPTAAAPHRRTKRTSAERRDGQQPRLVTSNVQSWNTLYGTSEGLKTPRDTGIRLTSRKEERRARKHKLQLQWGAIIVALCFVGLVGGIVWMNRSNADGARLAEKNTARAATSAAKSAQGGSSAGSSSSGPTGGQSTSADASASAVMARLPQDVRDEVAVADISSDSPTPLVAQAGSIKIHLPVSVADLTEVAFHQASYDDAVALTTHLKMASLKSAKKNKGTKRDKTTQQSGCDALLCGEALQYWRSNRHTAPTTALDCGAKAGSLVYAPVTGTVTRVVLYNYENKVNDYEIHIRPDGQSKLETVNIHMKSPYVREGDRVEGGVTPIARVRNMGAYVRNQLATYAPEKGNHTHLQVNDTTSASYKKRMSKKITQSAGLTEGATR